MEDIYIAHVRKKDDGIWDKPHSLLQHLSNTAKMAEAFADKFKAGKWGYAAGLAHDAGKGRLAWQEYLKRKSGYGFDEEAHLEGKPGKINHAIYGAKLVEDLYGKGIGRLLAYCIAGHHAGLPDWSGAENSARASLQFQLARLKNTDDIYSLIVQKIKEFEPGLPPWRFADGLDFSLWVRMLYSCLVDADFLDTEYYMDSALNEKRSNYLSNSELLARFNKYVSKLEGNSKKTAVNKIRKNVREKCVQVAKQRRGIFSLSVPTGGGKTLSTLAFGLEHALNNNMDRIIYVIPFTSIIEQNADVFRKAIGDDHVVEHHSSLDEDDSTPKSRLASENWDAPVIVTTSVQFFESLFSAKPSRCRKLHNIVNSVVVLDEAQLIPVDYLYPILETMQLLVDNYNVTFLISTATQPAFGERAVNGESFKGLKNIREIMGDKEEVKKLYKSLNRVQVKVPEELHLQSDWEEISQEITKHEQVLCVVSDRNSCCTLHSLMPDGTFHLSALMCGQHRSEVIERIKEKLKNKELVRVISTQLVEAGVDMDFPVVYRALAGLDSIAQAAGRCNREGLLKKPGKVIIFVPPKKAPEGMLRKGAETATNILKTKPDDPLYHRLFTDYFAELYWKSNSLDKKEIQKLLDPKQDSKNCGVFFRTAADMFRIIDDTKQKTVIVQYGESQKLIQILKAKGPERWLMRKLQRYTVNVYINDFYQMYQRGAIEEIYPNIFVLSSTIDYSEKTGLNVSETPFEPDGFII